MHLLSQHPEHHIASGVSKIDIYIYAYFGAAHTVPYSVYIYLDTYVWVYEDIYTQRLSELISTKSIIYIYTHARVRKGAFIQKNIQINRKTYLGSTPARRGGYETYENQHMKSSRFQELNASKMAP